MLKICKLYVSPRQSPMCFYTNGSKRNLNLIKIIAGDSITMTHGSLILFLDLKFTQLLIKKTFKGLYFFLHSRWSLPAAMSCVRGDLIKLVSVCIHAFLLDMYFDHFTLDDLTFFFSINLQNRKETVSQSTFNKQQKRFFSQEC